MHLNLSGIRSNSLPGRLLRLPLALLPADTTVAILQGPLRGARWVIGSSTHGCWLGSYEYEKQRIFSELVRPGQVVWDVGANVGFYTLLASRLVGPTGQVVAIEPLPANVTLLRRHIQINFLRNVAVVEAAVADRLGEGSFKAGENSSTGSLSDQQDGFRVRLVTLDSLIADNALPLPNLIKMDIEGGEVTAILGASKLLSSQRPILLLATHGAELHAACVKHLKDDGYSVEGLGGRDLQETDELLARPR